MLELRYPKLSVPRTAHVQAPSGPSLPPQDLGTQGASADGVSGWPSAVGGSPCLWVCDQGRSCGADVGARDSKTAELGFWFQ